MSTEDRIVQLETTVAFQEDLIEKMNALQNEQQLQLHRLEEAIKELRDQMKAATPSMIRDPGDETPPPHY